MQLEGPGRHGPGPTLYARACNFHVVSSPEIEKMQSFCPRSTAKVPSAGHASYDGPQLMSSKMVNLTTFKTQNEMNSSIGSRFRHRGVVWESGEWYLYKSEF